MKKAKYIIGIDEAGRGPLAGPVAVGAVLVPSNFDWSLIPGVSDSKKVSPQKREAIFKLTKELVKKDLLIYAVVMESAASIDRIGIAPAIRRALQKAITKAMKGKQEINEKDVFVKLDGGLKAPPVFVNQETIIKGDAKELVIGLASIMAKVTRDKYMLGLADQADYQQYDFAVHKGYGTKKHRAAIFQYGLSKEHRASFCKNAVNPQGKLKSLD